MMRKTCTSCHKRSYSSNASLRWICPYCQKDLTYVQAEPSEKGRLAVPSHLILQYDPTSTPAGKMIPLPGRE